MPNIRSNVRLKFFCKDSKSVLELSDTSGMVLSVVTHKELSNTAGMFSIVLSPRVGKSLISEKGQFELADLIKPFDLVQIEFKTDGDYKHEMLGVVSRPASSLTIRSNGVPTRATRIDGFDLRRVFMDMKLYFNPYIVDREGKGFPGAAYWNAALDAFKGNKGSTPAEFIKTLIQLALKDDVRGRGIFYPLGFGPLEALKVDKLVDTQHGISTEFNDYKLFDPFFLIGIGPTQEVSIWDLLKQYSDPPFHECFIDYRRDITNEKDSDISGVLGGSNTNIFGDVLPPDQVVNKQPCVFYMRTTPFSKAAWTNCPNKKTGFLKHSFLMSDVIQQDTAPSVDNVFNYFQVLCERENVLIGDIQVTALVGASDFRIPIIDVPSIQQFGLRIFPNTTTKYVEFVAKDRDALDKMTPKEKKDGTRPINTNILDKQIHLTLKLFEWFSFGELFESGTITLKGRVGIEEGGATIGSKLVELNPQGTPTGKEYYIEGVMQKWEFGKPMETSLAVTRGHFPYTKDYTYTRNIPTAHKVFKTINGKKVPHTVFKDNVVETGVTGRWGLIDALAKDKGLDKLKRNLASRGLS